MDDHNPDQEDPRWGLVEEGMLSPLLEEWRLTYLKNHAAWFELARETNRCAVWLHQEHFEAGNGGPANNQAPTAVRIYSRALNGFAAAVTLAERALAIEAAGAVRPIYEAGFWLSYLATEPLKALEELAVDEDHHAIRREKLLREKFPGDRALVSASETRQAKRAARLSKRRPSGVESVAAKMGPHSGYLEYRLVSSFYGHLSNHSLNALKQSVGPGAVINILGPHEGEIPNALYFAVDAMTRTASYFAVMMREDRVNGRLIEARRHLQSLAARTASVPVEGEGESEPDGS